MSKQVFLIRHGESESNAGAITPNHHATPLTPLGQRQATAVAQLFTHLDLIVTSSYTRAQQTAVPTQARFPHATQETWPIHELVYIDPQKYINTTGADRVPHIYSFMENPDPDFADGHEAESFRTMLTRVDNMLTRIQNSTAEQIAIFTHGAFLRLFWWYWLLGLQKGTTQKAHFGPFALATSVPNTAILPLIANQNGQLFLGQMQTTHLTPTSG